MNFRLLFLFTFFAISCSTTKKEKDLSPKINFFPNTFDSSKHLDYNFAAFLHKDLLVKRFGNESGITSTDYLSKEDELKLRKKITTEAVYNSLIVLTRLVDAVEVQPRFDISESFDCEPPKDHFGRVLNGLICKGKTSGTVYQSRSNSDDEIIDPEVFWKRALNVDLMSFLKKEDLDLKNSESESTKYGYSNLMYDLEDNGFVYPTGKIKESSINFDTEISKTISAWSGSKFYMNVWPLASEEDSPLLINHDLAFFISSHLPILDLSQCQSISANLIERGKELMINDLIEDQDDLDAFKNENFCSSVFGYGEDQKSQLDKRIVLSFGNLKNLWKIILLHSAQITPSKKKINGEDAVIINVKIDLPSLIKEFKVQKRTDFIKK